MKVRARKHASTGARALAPAVVAELGRALDDNRARTDAAARREADPVGLVHAYADPLEREIVGLLASSFAFGNVKALRAKTRIVLDALGPRPLATLDRPAALEKRLATFRHRVYGGGDVTALLVGARRVQKAHGSLGAAFASMLDASASFEDACDGFVSAIRAHGLAARTTHGSKHILVSPRGGSAAKRLMLYLRWMVRGADGVDLGLWPVAAKHLVVPLDVHVHKIARNVGLTARTTASWVAAREITEALGRLDPEDPVKYDFSLCHLGMVQGCRSRRDATICSGCAMKPICRHWRGRRGA